MVKKIKDITKPIPSISHALAQWDKEKTVADFVKDELMQLDPKTKKPLRSTVVQRLVYLTKNAAEEINQIKAADILFKTASSADNKNPTVQVNNQYNLGQWAESLK